MRIPPEGRRKRRRNRIAVLGEETLTALGPGRLQLCRAGLRSPLGRLLVVADRSSSPWLLHLVAPVSVTHTTTNVESDEAMHCTLATN